MRIVTSFARKARPVFAVDIDGFIENIFLIAVCNLRDMSGVNI
jgi:hypothetical protein